MAIPNFISGIFGVTEPAIYGILLPLKKPFIISCIVGGIGGAFYGHFNFRKFILGGMGIFELPNMMNPDGTISAFFPTGHAIGLTTTAGVELLIHVGMDTVQLEGKGFTPLAKAGDVVKKGEKLLEFDLEMIKEAGFSLATPVLVANYGDYQDILSSDAKEVQPGDVLLMVE